MIYERIQDLIYISKCNCSIELLHKLILRFSLSLFQLVDSKILIFLKIMAMKISFCKSQISQMNCIVIISQSLLQMSSKVNKNEFTFLRSAQLKARLQNSNFAT